MLNINRTVFKNVLIPNDDALARAVAQPLNLFENCNIVIDSASQLNNYRNNYQGFVNCRFRIGAETEATLLTGTTEDELRTNFKARCEAQGFAVPNVTDYGETLPMGRWVFADKCTFDGYIQKGSIIDNFQTRRFILLGNTGKVVDTLPITLHANTPMSFNPNNPKGTDVILTNGSISLPDTKDLSRISDNSIESGVGLLQPNGLAQLALFDIVHNMDAKFGVRVAGDRAFGTAVASGTIVADTNYLVRSIDTNEATVTYNGIVYSSSLATRNNIFRGVADKPTFATSGNNAVVYPVTDLAQQSIVEMRIVRDLPLQKIMGGNLLPGFWYFVASGDVNNPTGTIRYKGVDYAFGSSFLVSAEDLTFQVGSEAGNNLHLRRCWADNYDPNDTEYVDYAFWQGKQKPQWIKVIPGDLRCLMLNDKLSLEVMDADSDGNYLASGHPDFYSLIQGESGFIREAQPIVGRFFQSRLNISTFNAM